MKDYTKIFSLCIFCFLFISCNGEKNIQLENSNSSDSISSDNVSAHALIGDTVSEIGNNVRSIFQDSKNNYWFGTDRDGLYYFDGKTILWFNEKHGLANNQVRSIQEDQSGNLWFETGYGVSRFDWKTFTTVTSNDIIQPIGTGDKNWKTEPGDLWFAASDKNGVYRYDGISLTNLSLHKTNSDVGTSQSQSTAMNPYSVYSILKDRKGNVWFGTQTVGVCCYDGKNFTWFTEKDLGGPAVRALFEDKNGNMWFGNNGGGLFKYNGTTLANITEENDLTNSQFLKNSQVIDQPGTLARVWTINEDTLGDIWIGTIDAGVWRYSENKLKNYTTKDGLPSNVVNVIYKDKQGELWFGTDANGVYKFIGEAFVKFDVN